MLNAPVCLLCCAVCMSTGTTLHLDGMDAFDAATHCASLTAAERLTRQQQRQGSSDSQQQRQAHAGSRPQHGATADVQLQVAAQHSSGHGGCPNSTAQH